jgi:hypothetical protein
MLVLINLGSFLIFGLYDDILYLQNRTIYLLLATPRSRFLSRFHRDIYVPKLGICGTTLQLTNSSMCNGIANPVLLLPALYYSRKEQIGLEKHEYEG